ncbi:MAG TPA: MFS transporter, partial [Ilumatobacteraceae bacterium]|nr:MFS transporter [Ilumatobacteraceae bacterium]
DRLGRKPMLLTGLAIFLAGAVISALMPTFGGLLFGRMLWGLGASAPRSLAIAMVRDSQHGEQMARTMSLAMAVFLLVPIFAPTLGQVLISFGPWRIVFWVPAVAALLLVVWIWRRLPESLPVERRRSVSPRALGVAFREVLRSRQTVLLGLAATFLYGAMTSFLTNSEIVVEDVFGRGDIFALLFGLIGITLAAGSLSNANFVHRLGLVRMLRLNAIMIVAAGVVIFAVTRIDGGHPPLWLFWLAVALFMPSAAMANPNCNTAAMLPVPHVAGMAAAVIGAIATAGGAVLSSVVDGAFDGSVAPFGTFALVYVVAAAVCILAAIRQPAVFARTTVITVADAH